MYNIYIYMLRESSFPNPRHKLYRSPGFQLRRIVISSQMPRVYILNRRNSIPSKYRTTGCVHLRHCTSVMFPLILYRRPYAYIQRNNSCTDRLKCNSPITTTRSSLVECFLVSSHVNTYTWCIILYRG